jgi:hypothetical protein
MVNEGALRQFLVMAFEHMKAQEQALADVNTELSILREAVQMIPDKTLSQAAAQARHTRQRLRADAAMIPHGADDSGSEYDQIIRRLLNREVC